MKAVPTVAADRSGPAPQGLLDAAHNELARRRKFRIKTDPREWRKSLLIDCDGVSAVQDSRLDPWQRFDFENLDNGWRQVVGVPMVDNLPLYQRAYFERPRGHSKTTDLGSQALYAIYSSPRKIRGVAAAAAKKQAGLLREAIDTILRLNGWLRDEIEITKWTVFNRVTGSSFEILASDENTSMGETADFVIVDELTHWKKQALWTSIFSTVAKRSRCMLVVIANAGNDQGHGWRWETREKIRNNPAWIFHRLEGPEASWISAAHLAEQRDILLPADYKRLWLNQWQTGTGEGLDPEAIERAVQLVGPWSHETVPYHAVVSALDLGLVQDHSGFVVLGLDCINRRADLLLARRWDPAHYPTRRIPLDLVEREVIAECLRLKVDGLAFDPYQCERSAIEIARFGIPCHRWEFTPKNSTVMAKHLLRAFTAGTVRLYREKSLLADLAKMSIVPQGMGWKIKAVRDDGGHCDLGTALAMALPWAEGTMDRWQKENAA